MRRNFKVAPKFLENLRNPALQDPYICFNIHAKLCYIALKWNSHIQVLANNLSKVSFMIKSSKEILSPYMIRNIYFTKFQALLRSGILFWEGIGGELSIRIFRIQKRVIRLLAGASLRTSCRQLFKELNILTVASLYIFEVTCFIRKYCQSLEQNTQVH